MEEQIDLLFFTGFQKKVAGNLPEKLELFFNEHNCNSYFFYDSSKTFFLDGDDDSDDERELIKKISDIINEERKTIFVGSSGGGFPAIKYGAMFDSQLVITVSGFTSFDDRIVKYDKRSPEVLQKLNNLVVSDKEKNLYNLLNEKKDLKTKFILYYPTKSTEDKAQALNLSKHKNVELRGKVSDKHLLTGIGFDLQKEIITEIENLHK